MENVLLREWLVCYGREHFNDRARVLERYGDGYRHEDFEERVAQTVKRTTSRHELVRKFAFSVPCDEALDALVALSPLVEVCAGTGYWAALLADRGADVIAYDNALPGTKGNAWYAKAEPFCDVRYGGGETVAKEHADRTLVLMWPPYGEPHGHDIVRAYTDAGGHCVVYVGEGYGGCCGDDDLFVLLGDSCWHEPDDPEDICNHPRGEWHKVREIALPQWEGIHDGLTIYERNEEGGTE